MIETVILADKWTAVCPRGQVGSDAGLQNLRSEFKSHQGLNNSSFVLLRSNDP